MKPMQKDVGNINHGAAPISDEAAHASQVWTEDCEAHSGHFRHQSLPRRN